MSVPDDLTEREAPLDDPRAARAVLVVTSLFVAAYATGYISTFTPLGDDASSHITTIARFAEALRQGRGWWSPDYNLGFPLGLYYQPLPHLASALLCAALGGAPAASITYKVLLATMLIVQPWAVYAGLRRAGVARGAAALAGALCPLVLNGIDFGYHAQASLTVGLYTQAWGNVALPLAFGELVALAHGRGSVTLGAIFAALTASTHMFFAIALVPAIALIALAGPAPHRGIPRLAAAGVGAFCLLAAWLVPLSLNQAFFGGWPFGSGTRVDGYGFAETAKLFTHGILDDERPPILLGAATLGLLVSLGAAIWRRGTAPGRAATALLILFGWALVGAVGRAGFGHWIDFYPLHHTIQLFRYASLLQFALVAFAGIGLRELGLITFALTWRRAPCRIALAAPGLAIAITLASPIVGGAKQLDVGFRTIDENGAFRPAEYAAAASFVAGLPPGGRVLVSKRTGLRGHYHSGLFAWASHHPAGQSYGVGLHDSLNFYTLEFFRLDRVNARVLAELYDFRTIVADHDADISGLGDIDWIYDGGRYRVGDLQNEHRSVALMHEAGVVVGTPRGARQQIRDWLAGDGPRNRQTYILDVDDPRSRDDLTGDPVSSVTPTVLGGEPPHGRVVASAFDVDAFAADVELDEPTLLVAKIGYHPFWHLTVDGLRVQPLFAFPGMIAARLPAGTHRVEGVFHWPRWNRVLLALALVPLALLPMLDRRLRRRSLADGGAR